MYNIGDRITYPMHGAGVITGIQQKKIDKEIIEYYQVNIVSEGMDILIPVAKAEGSGVRPVATREMIENMLKALRGEMGEVIPNWNKRFQSNLEKLKTGDPDTCARVVRDLTLMDRSRGLSSGEKRMLFGARNYLISEVMMVLSVDKATADAMIEKEIGQEEC